MDHNTMNKVVAYSNSEGVWSIERAYNETYNETFENGFKRQKKEQKPLDIYDVSQSLHEFLPPRSRFTLHVENHHQ